MLLSLETHGPSISLMSPYISYPSPWPCLLRTDLEASFRHWGYLVGLLVGFPSLYSPGCPVTRYVDPFPWQAADRACAFGKATVEDEKTDSCIFCKEWPWAYAEARLAS